MITTTALKSPRYLAALKTAALQAVRLAHSRVCPAAACWVKNRRGEASVYAQFCRGRSVEFFDTNGRNVTDLVLGALREWHAMKRRTRGGTIPGRVMWGDTPRFGCSSVEIKIDRDRWVELHAPRSIH